MADIDYSIKDIEKLVKVNGEVKKVEVSRLTAPGENYLSLVLRVDFEVEKDGVSKTFSTVAKRLPLGERKMIDFNAHAMTCEIKFYTEILKLITDFAKEQGIGDLDFFPEYCASRYSFDSEKKAADKDSFLLLENLIPQGFKNEDRYKGFDLITTKAILKRLAMFHSIVIAIKFKNPDLFKILKDFLDSNIPKGIGPADGKEPNKEATFGPPPGGKSPEELILDVMMDMPECAPYIDRLKPLKDKPKGPMTWHHIGPEPWNTILHNDFWVNNIMVNPREGKEPLIKIVDFQVTTYGSFAKDLVFFLLSSVDNDVTTEYMDDLLRYYYEEFTAVLKKTNVDVKPTYTAFLKEVQRTSLESEFCHVLFFTTIIFGEKGTGLDAAIQEFNPFEHIATMIKKMNQQQKDKLVVIAREAAQRNWI